MSDLIERLDALGHKYPDDMGPLHKAADEIERLNKQIASMNHAAHAYDGEVERLRAALERIANDPGGHPDEGFPLRQMASEALKDD